MNERTARNQQHKKSQKHKENFQIFVHYKRIREHIDHNSNGQTHINPIEVPILSLSSESARFTMTIRIKLIEHNRIRRNRKESESERDKPNAATHSKAKAKAISRSIIETHENKVNLIRLWLYERVLFRMHALKTINFSSYLLNSFFSSSFYRMHHKFIDFAAFYIGRVYKCNHIVACAHALMRALTQKWKCSYRSSI